MLDVHPQVGYTFYTHPILGWGEFHSSLDVTSGEIPISGWDGCMMYITLGGEQIALPDNKPRHFFFVTQLSYESSTIQIVKEI